MFWKAAAKLLLFGSRPSKDCEQSGPTMADHPLQPLALPQLITPEWVAQAQAAITASTWQGLDALKTVLPKQVVVAILERTERLVQREASLVEVTPPSPASTVVVVGDTHGQFHDVCRMFEVAGPPTSERMYILNGDFVDRGAWGLETLVLFCCWKLALPHQVFMLRGNHETVTCGILYGFKGELEAKYGKAAWKNVFAAAKKLFAALPLAAVVNRRTLVLHGGLFRKPPGRATGKAKRKRADECALGTLADLRKASKGGLDPGGLGASRLATDVLWSDPTKAPGFVPNDARGVGMTFGPEVTEEFLRDNGLSLILRSHEGPDARDDREDMGSMLEGWTEDHVTPAGRLLTVFSAPDYPQFMAADAQRYRNKAAVAVLRAPDYDAPAMTQYEAALPRPQAKPYYDLYVNDSDEELETVPSTVSGMTDVREEKGAAAAAAAGAPAATEEEEEEEVDQRPAKRRATVSPTKGTQRAVPVPPESPTKAVVSALVAAAVDKVVREHDGGEHRAHSRGTSPTRWHPHQHE